MKQMIILLSMILLGIAISVMVLSFKDTSQNLTDTAHTKIQETVDFG